MTALGMETPSLVRDLLRTGDAAGAGAAMAIFWLAGAAPPAALLLPGVPEWLCTLGDTTVVRAMQRRGADGLSSYAVELLLTDGARGSLLARVDVRQRRRW